MQDAGPESAPAREDPQTVDEVEERQQAVTTIYDVTNACFDVFERLSSAADGDLYLQEAFLLFDSDSSAESPRDMKGLRNNFAFWIDYTGALAPVGASLDDRLHGHDEIKEMILELLEMVDRNLHCLEREKTGNPAFLNTKPPIALTAIDSALNRLHFLGKAIRKASAVAQEQDIFTFESDEDRFFHSTAISYVKWKCPKARPSLREHMGDAIAGRRRILLQKHQHARKLNLRRAPKPSTGPMSEQHHALSVKEDASKPPMREDMLRGRPSVSGSRATRASRMDKRAFLQRIHQKPALSIRSSGSSQQGSPMSAEYPDPPRVEPGGTHVQCPYCLEPLPAAEMREGSKNEYWRRHVNQDLLPYVCLFRRCANSCFSRRSEWSKHMVAVHSADWPSKVHTMTWYCDLGHQQPAEFDNEMDWRKHMKDLSLHTHRSKPPTDAQLDVLAVRKQQKACRDPNVCPFCEDTPQQIAILGDRGNPADVTDILVKHISEHVKSLLFLSLPEFGDTAVGDDRSLANLKDSSAKRLRNSGSLPQPPSGAEFLEDVSLTFPEFENYYYCYECGYYIPSNYYCTHSYYGAKAARDASNTGNIVVAVNQRRRSSSRPTRTIRYTATTIRSYDDGPTTGTEPDPRDSTSETEPDPWDSIPETEPDFWDFIPRHNVPLSAVDTEFVERRRRQISEQVESHLGQGQRQKREFQASLDREKRESGGFVKGEASQGRNLLELDQSVSK